MSDPKIPLCKYHSPDDWACTLKVGHYGDHSPVTAREDQTRPTREKLQGQVKQWLKDERIALEYYGGEHCASDLITTYLLSKAGEAQGEAPQVETFCDRTRCKCPSHRVGSEAPRVVKRYFCGLCGDSTEPCEHQKEVDKAQVKDRVPMDIGGSDAFHDWPQAAGQAPQCPTCESTDPKECHGHCPDKFHDGHEPLRIVQRKSRVETGAHPSQDARAGRIARRAWAKRLVQLVIPHNHSWAELDELTTRMDVELKLYDEAGARSTPSPDPPPCSNCANLETALEQARAERNKWEDNFDEACRLGGIVKTGKEDAESAVERLREALRESEVVTDNLAAIAKHWVNAFDMYWRAWLREIGGVIVPKHHEIDGFVLRTREVYEKAKLVDRIKVILCAQLKAKVKAEEMFDAVFKMLAEDGNDKTATN